LGLNYFQDPKERLMRIKDANGQCSTGWKDMDDTLYGGFNRGELNIFVGGSGSGKSLFMQNIAVNWFERGLNGIYITLELSQEICSLRIDSITTSINSKEIFKKLDDVEYKVKMLEKKSGTFYVKYLPAQSNVNHIRSYCKDFEVNTGKKIDFLCIDYLDLLMPISVKVNPSDLFIKDKYVSEEIRNLAKELKVLCVTASQLNRSAVDESDLNHSHISGGISKINTADNVIGIFTSTTMRERGEYQLQLLKTRNSNGVGKKINLNFDIDTLKISNSNKTDSDDVMHNMGTLIQNNVLPNAGNNINVISDSKKQKLDTLLKRIKTA
jgi:replicative DNA helicase